MKDKIPVEVRSISSNMMGEPTMDILTLISIKKEKPNPTKFQVPDKAEGFEKSSMMDMMLDEESYRSDL